MTFVSPELFMIFITDNLHGDGGGGSKYCTPWDMRHNIKTPPDVDVKRSAAFQASM